MHRQPYDGLSLRNPPSGAVNGNASKQAKMQQGGKKAPKD